MNEYFSSFFGWFSESTFMFIEWYDTIIFLLIYLSILASPALLPFSFFFLQIKNMGWYSVIKSKFKAQSLSASLGWSKALSCFSLKKHKECLGVIFYCLLKKKMWIIKINCLILKEMKWSSDLIIKKAIF